MKVLCIGDSLGLPREECSYEDTWFYRLKTRFKEYEFIDYFVRGLEISDALHRYDTYFQYYEPEVVIIQTGVVDCAPRYINDHKLFIIALKKLFQVIGHEDYFWKIVKLRKRRPSCVVTKYEDFLNIYENLVNKLLSLSAKKIIIVKIGHAADSTLKSSPFFNSNVDRFNFALDDIQSRYSNQVIVVDPLRCVREEDFVDGYHCNSTGMKRVFNDLNKAIEEYVANR